MVLHRQNKITKSPEEVEYVGMWGVSMVTYREERANYLDQFDNNLACELYEDFKSEDKDTYEPKFCFFPTRIIYKDPIYRDLHEGNLVWLEFVGAKKVVDKMFGFNYTAYTDRYDF